MYSRDTRLKAMGLYMECRSIAEVARIMDGPSRSCIANWVAAAVGTTRRNIKTNSLTVDDKLDAVMRVHGGTIAPAVAKDIGVSSGAVYHWVGRYEKLGAIGLMGKEDVQPKQPPDLAEKPAAEPEEGELEALRQKCLDLQLEVDLMKGVVDIVKKRPRRRPGESLGQGEDDSDRRPENDVFSDLFGL